MNITEAARAAFEHVHGPRPKDSRAPLYDHHLHRYNEELNVCFQFLRALEQYGYKVVPVEPDLEQRTALDKEIMNNRSGTVQIYRAAIAASPEIPT